MEQHRAAHRTRHGRPQEAPRSRQTGGSGTEADPGREAEDEATETTRDAMQLEDRQQKKEAGPRCMQLTSRQDGRQDKAAGPEGGMGSRTRKVGRNTGRGSKTGSRTEKLGRKTRHGTRKGRWLEKPNFLNKALTRQDGAPGTQAEFAPYIPPRLHRCIPRRSSCIVPSPKGTEYNATGTEQPDTTRVALPVVFDYLDGTGPPAAGCITSCTYTTVVRAD